MTARCACHRHSSSLQADQLAWGWVPSLTLGMCLGDPPPHPQPCGLSFHKGNQEELESQLVAGKHTHAPQDPSTRPDTDVSVHFAGSLLRKQTLEPSGLGCTSHHHPCAVRCWESDLTPLSLTLLVYKTGTSHNSLFKGQSGAKKGTNRREVFKTVPGPFGALLKCSLLSLPLLYSNLYFMSALPKQKRAPPEVGKWYQERLSGCLQGGEKRAARPLWHASGKAPSEFVAFLARRLQPALSG